MINQIVIAAGGIAFVIGGGYIFHEADLYASALTAGQTAMHAAGDGAPSMIAAIASSTGALTSSQRRSRARSAAAFHCALEWSGFVPRRMATRSTSKTIAVGARSGHGG